MPSAVPVQRWNRARTIRNGGERRYPGGHLYKTGISETSAGIIAIVAGKIYINRKAGNP